MTDAATTERTPLQRIGDERLKKSLPAVPFEKPKAGVHRQAIWFWFEYDEFMPFLQSQKNILYPLPLFWTRTQPDRWKVHDDYSVNTEDFRYISGHRYKQIFP